MIAFMTKEEFCADVCNCDCKNCPHEFGNIDDLVPSDYEDCDDVLDLYDFL